MDDLFFAMSYEQNLYQYFHLNKYMFLFRRTFFLDNYTEKKNCTL